MCNPTVNQKPAHCPAHCANEPSNIISRNKYDAMSQKCIFKIIFSPLFVYISDNKNDFLNQTKKYKPDTNI